jgi:hypothetical protein
MIVKHQTPLPSTVRLGTLKPGDTFVPMGTDPQPLHLVTTLSYDPKTCTCIRLFDGFGVDFDADNPVYPAEAECSYQLIQPPAEVT